MSSLNQLKALGAFVSDAPVPKEIEFKLDDETQHKAVIHVKKLSVGDHEKLFIQAPDDKSRTAKLIADTITLGEGGKERIPFVDAYKLHPGIGAAMVEAFNEVNGFRTKNSQPPKS